MQPISGTCLSALQPVFPPHLRLVQLDRVGQRGYVARAESPGSFPLHDFHEKGVPPGKEGLAEDLHQDMIRLLSIPLCIMRYLLWVTGVSFSV